jgi:transcriptional regulator with XRE-family HTH domain
MNEQQQREYGAAVLSAIDEKGLYFREAVRALGISHDYLNRIIKGETSPGPATATRIALTLGVYVSSFEK